MHLLPLMKETIAEWESAGQFIVSIKIKWNVWHSWMYNNSFKTMIVSIYKKHEEDTPPCCCHVVFMYMYHDDIDWLC